MNVRCVGGEDRLRAKKGHRLEWRGVADGRVTESQKFCSELKYGKDDDCVLIE